MSEREQACEPWQELATETCAAYGPQALGDGSVVVLLLDDERRLTGRSLIRSVGPRLGTAERASLLGEAMHVLRHGHTAGEVASQCLLLTYERSADGEPGASAAHSIWWPPLQDACRAADLRPVDVVTLPVEAGVHPPP